MKVDMSGLSAAVEQELSEYGNQVKETVRKAVPSAAKTCQQEIKSASPRRTGKYAKGWRIKETMGRGGDVTETVHNAAAPQLTHLLENGHAKENGGRVEGKPHIAMAARNAEAALVNDLEQELRP